MVILGLEVETEEVLVVMGHGDLGGGGFGGFGGHGDIGMSGGFEGGGHGLSFEGHHQHATDLVGMGFGHGK